MNDPPDRVPAPNELPPDRGPREEDMGRGMALGLEKPPLLKPRPSP